MIRKHTFGTMLLEGLRIFICIVLALLILIPIIWMVFSSFRTNKDFLSAKPSLFPPVWTTDQYVTLFKRIKVLNYIKNSVIYAFSRTIGNIIFCSMAGYAFGRFQFKGKNFLFTLCLATMMVPFQIILVPSAILYSSALMYPELISIFLSLE